MLSTLAIAKKSSEIILSIFLNKMSAFLRVVRGVSKHITLTVAMSSQENCEVTSTQQAAVHSVLPGLSQHLQDRG